ncbi:ABC transporter substrate-binding protein [Microbacterium sp. NPDC096154]|uniref:ABC transporter substrate-binding protein n=1 Tax=Microbacterium sp. NPDC096154 TaxID=3155549 RepID=UPI003322984E
MFTDQRGVEHTFDEPITRVATTVIPAPSMITAIDQSYDRIVGVNQATIGRDKGSAFATMFPQSLQNTVIAGPDFVPNVEKILALDPDVVVQWGDRDDDATFITPIEDAGIPVVGLRYGTQADLETWIDMFGTMLQQEDRAAELIDIMHSSIDEVEAYAAEQGDSPRAMFLRGDGTGAYNAGMNSTEAYMSTWMTAGGATNVAPDVEYSQATTVSPEQILAWNPEVIFVSGMTPLTVEQVYADQALAGVEAVKNKRVYAVPSGGFWWDPPSAESNLMFQWAAEVLRPDDQAFDVRTAMKEHYAFLYDHQLSDTEIDRILKLDQNAAGAGYADAFAG